MIDLHLHLDGSLSPQTVLELASIQDLPLPAGDEAGLRPHLTAPARCRDLAEYLTYFTLPLSLLQSAEGLEHAVFRLVQELEKERLLYAEIRFAPQLHTEGGMSQKEAVQAALRGLARGLTGARLRAQLILCLMRRTGAEAEERNRQTLILARRYLGEGVCALDLAGDEAAVPTAAFADVFARARQADIPFTIHAGEAAGPESVRQALAMGARRIGHGVRAVEDPALVQQLAEKQIPLEICPTSNHQTGAAAFERCPIRDWLALGVPATVNTDNRTVSDTTIGSELMALKRRLGMTWAERCELLENAAGAAFLPPQEQERLRRLVQQAFQLGDWL